ncbi:unnamed protein product [Phytophthora fragariaefolia]|uniref:Unnamed protein product n=1 Tax=Phytophthora fragariaefolia TaxID=1490495 RepID=A0A9W6TZG6_9STRA|nr:unnamed protein product [Phytophthora fragariaefolia]
MGKLNEHLSVVVVELAKKEVYVGGLLGGYSKKLRLTGQLSKELASAQREIRELRRANDIQYILRKNSSVPAKLASDPRIPPRVGQVSARAMSVPEGLVARTKQRENVFSHLPDKIMLKLFSFLDEDSMVAMSVTDRVLVRKVNVLFGVTTPSTLANIAPNSAPRQRPPSPPTRKAHLAQVQTEKEDVAARLYSAESVRDFLMEKLKDLEDTLATSMTATAKKDEQVGLDREIIGFLDAKTQEYETALQEYAAQNNVLRVEIVRLQEDHASKTRVSTLLAAFLGMALVILTLPTTDHPRHGRAAGRREEGVGGSSPVTAQDPRARSESAARPEPAALQRERPLLHAAPAAQARAATPGRAELAPTPTPPHANQQLKSL